MAKRRYGKKAQQRELHGTLAILVVAVLLLVGRSVSDSTLLSFAIFVVCLVILGAAVYYYFVYRKTKLYQEGLRRLQIDDVDRMKGEVFEKYIADVFRRQGYLFETTALSGDFGVDLIIIKNGVRTAIQTKRYAKPVGQSAIREVVAGMKHYKCTQSAVVTNNYFTKRAEQLAKENNCELIDRDRLVEMISILS